MRVYLRLRLRRCVPDRDRSPASVARVRLIHAVLRDEMTVRHAGGTPVVCATPSVLYGSAPDWSTYRAASSERHALPARSRLSTQGDHRHHLQDTPNSRRMSRFTCHAPGAVCVRLVLYGARRRSAVGTATRCGEGLQVADGRERREHAGSGGQRDTQPEFTVSSLAIIGQRHAHDLRPADQAVGIRRQPLCEGRRPQLLQRLGVRAARGKHHPR